MKEKLEIVLIEDNPNDIKLISLLLGKSFMLLVHKVQAKDEFINILDHHTPDIIISDYALPVFDGMQALLIQKQMVPDIPFILVTGTLNEEIAVEVMKSGADDYVLKENLNRLVPAIKAAIDKKKLIQSKKDAEKALRESEEKYRTLLEHSGIGIGFYDLDGRIILFNQQALRQLGGKQEDYTGKTLTDIFGPGPGTKNLDRIRMAAGSETSLDFEDFIDFPSGQHWFLSNFAKVMNAAGEVTGVQVVAHDISDRKNAEIKLARSEARFRAVGDKGYIGITLYDRQGELIYYSRSCERITGYTREERATLSLTGWAHPDDRHIVEEAYDKLMRNPGIIVSFEVRMLHKNGSWIWIELTSQNLIEDPIVQAAVTSFRDITERKQLEEALRANSRYTQSLFEASLDPLVTISHEGKITDVNKAMELVTGLPRALLTGSDFTVCFTDPELAYTGYQTVLTRGEVRDHLLTIRHPSGRMTDVLFNASVYRNEQGEIQGVFAAARDITERKRAEEAVREAEAKYRTLVEQIPAITYIDALDVKGGTLYISPQIEQLLGFARDQWIKDPLLWAKQIHPDDVERVLVDVAQCKAEGKPFSSDYRLHARDGHTLWVHDEGEIVVDQTGRPLFLQGIMMDITERKQAENALHRSEAALKEAQRVGRLGSWDWDAETDTIKWSEEYYEIYGFDPALPPPGYKEHLNAYTPESAARLDAAVRQNMLTGEPYELDLELADKNGPRRWITARSESKYDANGRIIGLRGTAQDITERKQAEESLRLLNRELRAVSYCNQTLLRAMDEQTLLNEICRIICDEAGYRLAWVGYTGYDEARTVRPVAWGGIEDGYLNTANITWADTERGRGPAGLSIRTGKSVCIQDFASDPKAAPWREEALLRGYRSSIAMPLKNENAGVFGVLNIYSDTTNTFTTGEIQLLEELSGNLAYGIISLRTRAERQRAEEAVRQAKEDWEKTFDTVPDLVAIIDLEHRIVRANRAMAERLGRNQEQCEGLCCYEIIHNTDGPPEFCPHAKLMIDGKEHAAEICEKTLDGDFLITTSPIHDEHGRLTGSVHIARDITEHKREEKEIRLLNETLEERIKERTSQLEAANKELEAFTYTVSHDLRAPLRALDGFTRILSEDYAKGLDQEGLRLLNVIGDNAKKMGHLIDDLLSFSRLNRQEITKSRVDMGKIVKEILGEIVKPEKFTKNSISLGSLPASSGNPSMIKEVWKNLIWNAIKYCTPKPEPLIEIGHILKDDEVIYFVRDNGVGFDMRYYEKLFGVFQRLHSSTEFEGTGVGLAIVHRIIQRHNGRVWAEARVNEGATFYFSLPSNKNTIV